MKLRDDETPFARRRVLEAGVAGAALLVLPEGCSSSSDDTQNDAATDAHMDVTTKDTAPPPIDAPEEPEPDATLVDGGGSCKQDDWTRPISIMKAGIALQGTAYAFTDERFADMAFQEDRILVINPLTGSGYVAMSGVCTHMGCCPEYFAKCLYNNNTQVCSEASVTDGGVEAAAEGGADAAADGGADASTDAGSGPEAGDAGGGDAGSMVLTDVLWCPCHQSVYNAITGKAVSGPAVETGDLQIMKACVGGGYVFVTIPNNDLGAGIDPNCGSGS